MNCDADNEAMCMLIYSCSIDMGMEFEKNCVKLKMQPNKSFILQVPTFHVNSMMKRINKNKKIFGVHLFFDEALRKKEKY